MNLATSEPGCCPDCGARLAAEPWSAGLCLTCLVELGLSAGADAGQAGEADAAPTDDLPAPALEPGQVLGGRYRLRSRLGRGGMGEVFRAFDLKLRVDVALKTLRPERSSSERGRRVLRQEVRTAREVVSANVCRVFDLLELDGLELVSMEFVDGVTLADVLRERSPLGLSEARELAAQFLAGLEAIHAAGLVHRDVKPENLMLTRTGRVVVMDFGIARTLEAAQAGTVSGTPAYMAPEQARGARADARADVFSSGVVLAEMVAPTGVRGAEARRAVWRGMQQEPPEVGDTPWAPLLRKAVARLPEARHATAAALARALEEVTLQTAGDEAARPYPGLASFTEHDAGYFVGRELEIEELWKRLRRPHLLALIGPSGAGKSSFLRAGLGPTAPAGWRVIFATPRDRPFAALAHALAPELSGDAEAVAQFVDFEQPDVAVGLVARWRRRHAHALVVIDQFEELFTQSTPEVQARFAELVARLALEADAHVLVSMRDDFLFHCHRFESLAPVFSDLMPIGAPTGPALRRALVQPALKCGYRFEDEAIVEEMLAQVRGERGALPLVAFAMARLWDRRDRERGLLTRAAYDEIGGVSGALAQHAEATLERIGQQNVAIVRELVRNLVTAQGTRATLDRDELLSVFGDESASSGTSEAGSRRQQAPLVLDALVDARLLTSYELPSDERGSASRRRVEVVHESLLSAWPRLERWRTQDQEGAQLRDQLRQAARSWEERGQPEDLLWTGTSYREYELWRERYAGRLTTSESAFARAMTARTLRQKRRRRLGTAAVLGAALAVAVSMGVLWRRSEAARAEAVAAVSRAEAQQTFALGQLELEKDSTAALAYAMASLEQADTKHARLLALRALWRGPIAFALGAAAGTGTLTFSPDGRWLTQVERSTGTVRLWESDGSGPRVLPSTRGWTWLGWSADSRFMVLTEAEWARIYSLPGLALVRQIDESFRWGFVGGQELITGHMLEPLPDGRERRLVKIRRLPDGEAETLGVWTFRALSPSLGSATRPATVGFAVDAIRQRYFSQRGPQEIYELPLHGIASATPRRVVHGDEPIEGWIVAPDGERIYTWGESGAGRIWSRATGAPLPGPRIDRPADATLSSPTASLDGRWLAAAAVEAGAVYLWDLVGPVAAEPRALRRNARMAVAAFDPSVAWLAAQDDRVLTLWPLRWRHPHVLQATKKGLQALAIDPHGRWVAAGGDLDARAWLWPLRPEKGAKRVTLGTGAPLHELATSPRGDVLAAGTHAGAWLVPLDGGRPERLPGLESWVWGLAFDPEGRRLAAGGELGLYLWDLETRKGKVVLDGQLTRASEFLPDGRLRIDGPAGVQTLDLATTRATLVLEGVVQARWGPDGRHFAGVRGAIGPFGVVGTALVSDLEGKDVRALETHGNQVSCVAWDPSGRLVVTGSRDGVVRVGPVTGEEPHLLFGHDEAVREVAVDPEGRWIASASEDGTVRLWPLPLEGRPFHTLPHAELLERLRSFTNFRVVPDPAAAGGYRQDFEPFTGWKRKPPSW